MRCYRGPAAPTPTARRVPHAHTAANQFKIELALQYMPIRPRNTGQEWDVQVQVTPVIPKLIEGILFE